MAVEAQRVNVTSAGNRLDVTTEADYSGGANDFAQKFGQHILVRNRDATVSIFIGGADVTASTGFEVLAGETVSIDLTQGDALYGITASATVACHVVQSGV